MTDSSEAVRRQGRRVRQTRAGLGPGLRWLLALLGAVCVLGLCGRRQLHAQCNSPLVKPNGASTGDSFQPVYPPSTDKNAQVCALPSCPPTSYSDGEWNAAKGVLVAFSVISMLSCGLLCAIFYKTTGARELALMAAVQCFTGCFTLAVVSSNADGANGASLVCSGNSGVRDDADACQAQAFFLLVGQLFCLILGTGKIVTTWMQISGNYADAPEHIIDARKMWLGAAAGISLFIGAVAAGVGLLGYSQLFGVHLCLFRDSVDPLPYWLLIVVPQFIAVAVALFYSLRIRACLFDVKNSITGATEAAGQQAQLRLIVPVWVRLIIGLIAAFVLIGAYLAPHSDFKDAQHEQADCLLAANSNKCGKQPDDRPSMSSILFVLYHLVAPGFELIVGFILAQNLCSSFNCYSELDEIAIRGSKGEVRQVDEESGKGMAHQDINGGRGSESVQQQANSNNNGEGHNRVASDDMKEKVPQAGLMPTPTMVKEERRKSVRKDAKHPSQQSEQQQQQAPARSANSKNTNGSGAAEGAARSRAGGSGGGAAVAALTGDDLDQEVGVDQVVQVDDDDDDDSDTDDDNADGKQGGGTKQNNRPTRKPKGRMFLSFRRTREEKHMRRRHQRDELDVAIEGIGEDGAGADSDGKRGDSQGDGSGGGESRGNRPVRRIMSDYAVGRHLGEPGSPGHLERLSSFREHRDLVGAPIGKKFAKLQVQTNVPNSTVLRAQRQLKGPRIQQLETFDVTPAGLELPTQHEEPADPQPSATEHRQHSERATHSRASRTR